MPRKALDPVKNRTVRHSRGLFVGWQAGAVGLLAMLAASMAYAQDKGTGAGSGKLSLESDSSFGLLGSSHFRERSSTGDADAWDFGTRDVLSVQAREGFLIRFGLEWQRYNFSVPDSLQLPSKLQAA